LLLLDAYTSHDGDVTRLAIEQQPWAVGIAPAPRTRWHASRPFSAARLMQSPRGCHGGARLSLNPWSHRAAPPGVGAAGLPGGCADVMHGSAPLLLARTGTLGILLCRCG
jgi:hypothetical protein